MIKGKNQRNFQTRLQRRKPVLRIAIVEDEASCAEQLKEYIERYGRENDRTFEVLRFADGSEILQDYQPRYDIILLDIEMPKVTGMDAAKAIREHDDNVVLMFITNMAQYAIRGYSVGALDFVMKPVSYYTFQLKFGRAIQRVVKRRNEEILLTLPDRIQRVGVRSIYYVEVQDHMLHYHTEQGEYVLRGTLQNAEKQLAPYNFAKCNHWYIVNLMYVEQVRKDKVVVAGHELDISRRARGAFLNALTDYMGGSS